MNEKIEKSDREWWAQQWLDLINTYRFKKRLERGWKYAREGNVLSIQFPEQKVIAQVQGTEPEPYQVSLWLEILTDEDWDYIIENMAKRAIFSAKLLAGEMPQNIEEVFAAAGKRLFPFSLSEIHSRCSCPDKANPCKHISAVYYLLGERFSEDPFVLFQLRGRNQAQILQKLRQLRTLTDHSVEEELTEENSANSANFPDLRKFWQYDEPLESSLIVIVPPPSSETILDILGEIPTPHEDHKIPSSSPVSGETVKEFLQKIYQEVSQQSLLLALSVASDSQS